MLDALKAVLLDGTFKSYWLARAVTVAVSVLFGVTLKEMGYDSLTVLLAWSALLLLQTVQLFALGVLSERTQHGLSVWGGWFSVACAIWMLVFGESLAAFFLLILAQVPAVREGVISGMVYVRMRTDWPLGSDVASAIMNEAAKIFGALIICVLALSIGWGMPIFIMANIVIVLVILWALPKLPPGTESGGGIPSVGRNARRYLWMSFVHNGCMVGIQSFLTLAMYDLLKEAGFGSATIGVLGTVLALMMLIGLMVYASVRKRAGRLVTEPGTSPIFIVSMISLALVSVITFLVVALWQAQVLSPLTSAIAIGCLNGLFAALVGLYSVGTFQLMDASYRNLSLPDKSARLRVVFHLNMTVAHLAPALVLLLIYLANRSLPNLADLSLAVTGVIALIELILIGVSVWLARDAKVHPEPLEAAA